MRRPLLLATLWLLPAAALPAQKAIPTCKAVIDAERKQVMTPTHAYMTRDGKNAETITMPDAMYALAAGKWQRIPTSQKAVLAQLDVTLANTKNYVCKALADETIAGTSTHVYQAHAETGGARSEGKVWIDKRTGLIMRQDSDLQNGSGRPTHMSIRYDYINVHAPAGAQ